MLSTGTRTQTSRTDRRSQRCGLLLVGCLLLTSVLSPYPVLGAGLAPSQVVRLWILFYGQQDTLHAAGFTTARFRGGESPSLWAVKTQAVLHSADYHHLGGEIVSAALTETSATIVLAAKVHRRSGTSTQTETYSLQRQGGRWLIDRLEITDQVPHNPAEEADALEV